MADFTAFDMEYYHVPRKSTWA